jgi:membrane-associated phospholipid phosphatase
MDEPLLPKLGYPYLALLAVAIILIYEVREDYFDGFQRYLRSIPAKFYLLLISLLFISTGLVTLGDEAILGWARAEHDALWLAVAGFGREISDKLNGWIILTSLYFLAWVSKSRHWRSIAAGAVMSSSLTVFIVILCKFIFLRARPVAGLGPFSFFNLEGLTQLRWLFHSFPSGDVGVVAGASAYLFFSMKRVGSRWLLIILPLAAAFSRLSTDRHWPSDTFFSLGLGFLIAYFLWRFRKDEVHAS